ncbi:ABC transporter permease subunit [Paenibacillus aurantius]|uniref:ABC transporter permease subunit n=1 Tax=Paenibacillus aurantius TaxID=2918900 RepID=A0AA96RHD4_9BACL|nr:ABC transporter permease subunit [Paenibacillus aurantius]WNQ13243.1 ABC transporter permease subunit [Paenibacillus aurantius]
MSNPTVQLSASRETALRLQRRRRFRMNIPLLVMFSPILVYFILFKYVPMGGLIIAFKQYNLADGILGSPWTGLDNFRLLFNSPMMVTIIKNTFVISILSVLVSFPFPILLAILLNEVRGMVYKRTIQTLVYLPHFLNWVIIGSFVVLIFAQEQGVINKIISALGGEKIQFLYNKSTWLGVFLGSGIWKEAGFGAIIYLAALGNIDPSLYESSSIDGANKLRQMWHITIPGIAPVIILMLILSMEHVMDVGFDQIYVLKNPMVGDIANVISVWSYEVGLGRGQFSITTALGFFQSLVGLVLVLTANKIARKFGQGLW